MKYKEVFIELPTSKIAEQVQRRLLKDGYKWCGGQKYIETENMRQIYIDDNKNISYATEINYVSSSCDSYIKIHYTKILKCEWNKKFC